MGEGTTSNVPAGSEGAHPRRPWWRKAILGLLTVVLILSLLEGALWVVGAPRGGAGDPFVGFTSSFPHFELDGDTVRRPEMRATVMNPFEFERRKPEGALRVVCVGGSTTYGRPFFDATSFPGFLRVLLAAGAAGRETEVINAGAISYASYRVTGVLREAVRFDPDVVVIYTGHNEFLESRTYGEVKEIPAWLRELSAAVGATRTGTLVRRTLTASTAGPDGLGEQVRRIPANAVGPEAYHRDDAWRDRVVDEFRRALHAMLDITERAGTRAVLVVPAANVADWRPWGSAPSEALAVADVARFLELLDEARAALAARDAEGAEAAARVCVELDPRHADAWFLLGRALRARERPAAAAGAYRRALEEDVVPLRAVEALRDVVREVGTERETAVVELEPLLRPAREAGVPGDESFADHVHPWPDVNLRLAEALAQALVDDGVLPLRAWDAEAARFAAAQHLGSADPETRARELFGLAYVLASFDRVAQARARCERGALLLGGGPTPLAEAARMLAGAGDLAGALEFAERAVAADGASAVALTRLGAVLADFGREPEARETLERAITIAPDTAEAHARLGALHAAAGELGEAEGHFRDLVALRPDTADSHYNLGLVLARRGRAVDAAQAFRAALAIDDGHAEAQRQLDALER